MTSRTFYYFMEKRVYNRYSYYSATHQLFSLILTGIAQMASQKKELITDFTQGPVFKQLVRFSLPLFLANLLQIVYNLADMVIVGKAVGSTGLSAVSIGGDITLMLTMLIMGFANAAQVIIAQFIGAHQRDKISKLIGTFISFLAICIIVLTVAALLLRNDLLTIMNTPAESWDGAYAYSVTCSAGLVFIFGYNAISAILRGLGDSKRPFIFIAVAALLNIGLDLLFVLNFGMGAFGAALATVISQAISFLSGLLYLIKVRDKLGFEMHVKDIHIEKTFLAILVKLGLPMALMHSCVCFTRLFVNSYVNSYGLIISAVGGIGSKIHTIAMLISTSLNTAGASMIGQNIGGEKYERVPKIMLSMFCIVMSIYTILSAAIFLFPEEIFSCFTNDKAVIALAYSYMPVAILAFYGFGVRCPMTALINGCGNYKMNFLVALLDALVLRIGLSLLMGLGLHMEYMGFWYGDALAGYTPLIIGLIFLASGKWKTRKYVIKEDL